MPGRPYDFWLLDLDGTLVDVETSYVHEVIGRVGERLGTNFDATEAERLWYEDESQRDAVLDAHEVDPARFWRVFHDVEEPETRADATYVYDDAAAVVPTLETPVGLVTHCQPYLTEPILEQLDIADWFDTVVCCGDDVGWKPDPGPLELAMADLGVAGGSGRGVMAGDALADVGAANNAGLDAVHVARDPQSNGTPGATLRVSTLNDVQK